MPGGEEQRKSSGWAPYWAPMITFLVIVELSGRVSPPFNALFLVLRVIAPFGLFVFFALRGAYPELRGARWGAWAVGDVAIGLLGAAPASAASTSISSGRAASGSRRRCARSATPA